MRAFGLLLILLTLALPAQTQASIIYYVDFTNPVGITTTPEISVRAPSYEGWGAQQTPVLHFPAPGIVDFGTATVGPLFGGDSRYGQLVLYFFGPGMGVSYDPLTPPSPFTNFATLLQLLKLVRRRRM